MSPNEEKFLNALRVTIEGFLGVLVRRLEAEIEINRDDIMQNSQNGQAYCAGFEAAVKVVEGFIAAGKPVMDAMKLKPEHFQAVETFIAQENLRFGKVKNEQSSKKS